jgi:hypothetical protein
MEDIDMPAADVTAPDDSPKKKKKSIREAVQENEKEVVGGIRNISAIRSKIRRNQEWVRLKKDKRKEKRKRQDDRRKV